MIRNNISKSLANSPGKLNTEIKDPEKSPVVVKTESWKEYSSDLSTLNLSDNDGILTFNKPFVIGVSDDYKLINRFYQ